MVLYSDMFFFFLMIRRPPISTQSRSSAASDVYKRQFMDEVINLMVAYSLGRTRSTNVNREYISKVANDFAFKKIVTAEQGLLALRSGYDKKSQRAKDDSKKKTNVPSWSDPDYDLSLIHISEPTRLGMISYAVFCLKKKKKAKKKTKIN